MGIDPGGRPSARQLVFVPAIITLVVTVLRLVGEVRDWDRELFSNEPGGKLAFFGIVWLVPLFGFYFGWKLARAGYGPRQKGMAILAHVAAMAIFFGTGFGLVHFEVEFPMAGFLLSGAAWVYALIALRVWPALFWVNTVYGFMARLPVVAVTFIAVYQDWGTHYEKLGPDNIQLPVFERAMFLSLAQVGFWMGFTIIVGGLFGSIAALFTRSR